MGLHPMSARLRAAEAQHVERMRQSRERVDREYGASGHGPDSCGGEQLDRIAGDGLAIGWCCTCQQAAWHVERIAPLRWRWWISHPTTDRPLLRGTAPTRRSAQRHATRAAQRWTQDYGQLLTP